MNFNGKHFLDKFSQHDKYDESVVLHTYHTKPIVGEKPPRKKAGFKVTAGNKDFFCKLGKKLVHQRNLILNEQETVKEFKAFGRSKNGRWKGIGTHDDIAMSAVNVSHLFEEPEYEDWLYDFLEEMEETPVKLFISQLLEKYTESGDVDDDSFTSLYQDEISSNNIPATSSQAGQNYSNPYANNNVPRYTPSSTFSKGSYQMPWSNR
jgi:hypothetical protein